jgi:hypothetical protein
MGVVDDRGFKTWGNAPEPFRGGGVYMVDEYVERPEVERGDRVTFTARLKRSDKDEYFGFYSRPTKARILARDDETKAELDTYIDEWLTGEPEEEDEA